MTKFSYLGAALALALSTGAAMAQTPASPPAATQSSFSDAQLQAFAAASLEIDPISRALPSATAAQRTQATTQIRTILQRHNIDSATYNAIAARAQSDQEFAARIQTLHRQAQAPATSGDSGE